VVGNPVLLRCMELIRQRYTWKIESTLGLTGRIVLGKACEKTWWKHDDSRWDLGENAASSAYRSSLRRVFHSYGMMCNFQRYCDTLPWQLLLLDIVCFCPSLACGFALPLLFTFYPSFHWQWIYPLTMDSYRTFVVCPCYVLIFLLLIVCASWYVGW